MGSAVRTPQRAEYPLAFPASRGGGLRGSDDWRTVGWSFLYAARWRGGEEGDRRAYRGRVHEGDHGRDGRVSLDAATTVVVQVGVLWRVTGSGPLDDAGVGAGPILGDRPPDRSPVRGARKAPDHVERKDQLAET
jgi:hypothetical protein